MQIVSFKMSVLCLSVLYTTTSTTENLFELVALLDTPLATKCASCDVPFSYMAPAPEDVVVRHDDRQ
ncbi:unnamed protein product [Gongylonema pulchrum]|uniref:Secreted protein n=1 Tax=Gongylonema pulchrum TaxID=637853 RepID=A0A183DPJ1_9BILA|nr:unnamed protein product [Gongylonema pulchrum]